MSNLRNQYIGQSGQEFCVGLDTQIPDAITKGKSNIIHLSGWCYHKTNTINRLEIAIDNHTYPVMAHSILRKDINNPDSSSEHSKQKLCRSGFWALIPLLGCGNGSKLDLDLQATLNNGSNVRITIASIQLCAEFACESLDHSIRPNLNPRQPLVAICMATYNPPRELFIKQIASIINQTYENWICIISDDASDPVKQREIEQIIEGDPRFLLSLSPARIGFYHNFERCLSLVPEEAEFIALADQDDGWYSSKLETLVSNFDKDTTLVYSDMRIISGSGEVISNTYWTSRRNNNHDLCSLLLFNTITGAASMFPRRLLSYILPFPLRIGNLYHDHWIASVALAMGKVNYIDHPLYDYTQHASNVIGYLAPQRERLPKLIYSTFNNLRTREGRSYAREAYFMDVIRIMAIARLIILRTGQEIVKDKLKTLQRIAYLDQTYFACLWLAMRGLKEWNRISLTFGTEYHLLLGVVWKIYIILKSRFTKR